MDGRREGAFFMPWLHQSGNCHGTRFSPAKAGGHNSLGEYSPRPCTPGQSAKTYLGNVHFRWKSGKIPVMSGGLIERFLSSCRHQFAWPRRAENGDYYQLCVHCGAKYLDDWGNMRRLSLAEDEEDGAADQVRSSVRKCGKRVAW